MNISRKPSEPNSYMDGKPITYIQNGDLSLDTTNIPRSPIHQTFLSQKVRYRDRSMQGLIGEILKEYRISKNILGSMNIGSLLTLIGKIIGEKMTYKIDNPEQNRIDDSQLTQVLKGGVGVCRNYTDLYCSLFSNLDQYLQSMGINTLKSIGIGRVGADNHSYIFLIQESASTINYVYLDPTSADVDLDRNMERRGFSIQQLYVNNPETINALNRDLGAILLQSQPDSETYKQLAITGEFTASNGIRASLYELKSGVQLSVTEKISALIQDIGLRVQLALLSRGSGTQMASRSPTPPPKA